MGFIILIFLAALSIEGIGTYVSVIGLSSTFQGDPVILTLAIILDFAKVIGVSLLYKKWKVMPVLLKAYLVPAVAILMMITSYGAAGYLSDKFTHATLPAKEAQIELVASEDEKAKAEARLKQINDGIAAIGANYISKRLEEKAKNQPEVDRLNARIIELDKSIPILKQKIVNIEAHIGPISYVSKTFNVSNETALSYIIILVIVVFDPLAIMLIIAGNFLLAQREDELKAKEESDAIKHENSETERVADLNDEIERLLAEVDVLKNREPEVVEKVVTVAPEFPENIHWVADETVEYAIDKNMPTVMEPVAMDIPNFPDFDFAKFRIAQAERDAKIFTHSTWEEDELADMLAEEQKATVDEITDDELADTITEKSEEWSEEQKEEVKAILDEIPEPTNPQPVTQKTPPGSEKISIIPDGTSYHDEWDGGIKPVPQRVDGSAMDGVDPRAGDVSFNDSFTSDGPSELYRKIQ